MSAIYNFYKELSQDSFVLVYLGEFDDELTSYVMSINDAGKSEMKSSRKKISYLIAESFQNIIRHSDKKNSGGVKVDIPEMFILRDRNTIHHLVTTNVVKNEYVKSLTEKLESLKNLKNDELNELYRHLFDKNSTSERGGAGLGLIDMARKSGIAPSFRFIELGSGFSNFFMQVNVLPKSLTTIVSDVDVALDSAITLYDRMTVEKILIAQKGDFSQEAILPLIQLVENNLSIRDEHIGLARRVLFLLIEMLQNMTRHAEKINGMTEGIFYISEKESKNFEINTGNFLKMEDAKLLEAHLKSIFNLDKKELLKKHEEKLLKHQESEGNNVGMGLIEICRRSSQRIVYDIFPVENERYFFSLKVKV